MMSSSVGANQKKGPLIVIFHIIQQASNLMSVLQHGGAIWINGVFNANEVRG